ncbi:hypothetical protein MMC12_002063 [Toensbergia leucococca]|nr:hypothetical protein [Toensbergia leucococca]
MSPPSRETTKRTSRLTRRQNSHPLVRRKDFEPDQRRDMFLRRIRQTSENRNWGSRGDQILRSDFISRQRQWEAEKACSAPEAPAAPEEEEIYANVDDWLTSRHDLDMVDKILLEEDQEVEALVALMLDEARGNHDWGEKSIDYGSGDEEYDRLFAEVISKIEGEREGTACSSKTLPEAQDMDTSVG